MKTYILGLLAVIMTFTSCTKQLEEYNPGGTTAESLFKTPEGIESALNGVYSYNRYFYGKEEGYALLEMGTDLWAPAANNGGTGTNGVFPQPPLSNYQALNGDNLWIKNRMWQQCYAAINLANTALKYINEAGLIAARKTSLEAELRFLRAWYYWHLTETFGKVPIRLLPTEEIITTATREPIDAVYSQILNDLTFAVANVPKTTSEYGRITTPAAEAFLAKIYLTRGMDRQASNYAVKVLSTYSNYKLLTNYADLWSMSNQKNTEVLWAVNYSTNLSFNAGSNLAHTLFLMEYNTQPGMKRDVANGLPWVRYMPTLFMLNLFNEQNDARFNATFKTVWLANQTTANLNVGDTAILCSKYAIPANIRATKKYKIFDLNDTYKSDGAPNDRFHYISLKKFDDPTRASDAESQSSRDAYIIRLADMYLIAAEAQLKLGKPDSAAYYINLIRTRAALPGRQAAMQVTAEQMNLDFILDERAREFAGEQLRWFDLKRTGKLVERTKLNNPDLKNNIQPFHVLRPIPQSEIDAVTNKKDFQQNDGY